MSNKTERIIQLYKESLDDWAFYRTEKRNIQQEIMNTDLDSDDIGFLRRKIFTIAQQQLSKDNANSLFEWAERATQELMNSIISKRQINSEAFFSPVNECKATILRLIAGAKHQMKICVFTITDNDKLLDLGSDIERLVRLSSEVKMDNANDHMHHKFAVFDNTVLLTGSYNWTRNATL